MPINKLKSLRMKETKLIQTRNLLQKVLRANIGTNDAVAAAKQVVRAARENNKLYNLVLKMIMVGRLKDSQKILNITFYERLKVEAR